ncbi:BrnA antitoxin family protein [Skermanella rosea]|uniref:BrnA antitoxin family protein n=1 Tax=Skermanella rosea TaxID=1817965 RepID=UPI001931DE6D|nr:BrnA antitoxin family protein [Skermanella rosea]UEM05530.1 BrnA antitoxin family protein [Skermanella rosea]
MKEAATVRRSLESKSVGRTDWSKVEQLTDADIRAAVEDDPDAAPLLDAKWFEAAEVIEPSTKSAISIRLDNDVLDFFRTTSERYQTKINAVLRAYMQHELRKARR